MIEPIKIWIPVSLPTLNEMIKQAKRRNGNWSEYSDKKKSFTGAVEIYCIQQNILPIKGGHFSFTWFHKNRKYNPDNIAAGQKYILDGLVKAKVLANDGWDQVKSLKHEFRISKDTGVLVEITEAIV